jgi:chemotaxis protein MotB
MSAQSNARPIIKRKKIVKGDGHHGGAWKVAYADFVTAMMAFFMLMWLLGATTEKQRKGIADYFNPTIPSTGSPAAATAPSAATASSPRRRWRRAAPARGHAPHGRTAGAWTPGREDPDTAECALAAVEEALLGYSGESMFRDLLQRHIVTRISDEGLVIEIFDTETAPLFRPTEPGQELRALLPAIVAALALVENPVAIESHVARRPGAPAPRPGTVPSRGGRRASTFSRTRASRPNGSRA